MPHSATWKKAEKLKSRKHIERVFREGKSFSVFPYKVVFLVSPPGGGPTDQAEVRPLVGGPALPARGSGNQARSRAAAVQAGFGAASRNFKKAVDRNRIKRLSREAYRLQKGPLLEQLARKGLSMAVFFVFIGKELPDYPTVSAKIGVALQKLLKETA